MYICIHVHIAYVYVNPLEFQAKAIWQENVKHRAKIGLMDPYPLVWFNYVLNDINPQAVQSRIYMKASSINLWDTGIYPLVI